MNTIELENEEEKKIKAIKCAHLFTLRDLNGHKYCYACHEVLLDLPKAPVKE